MFLESFRYRNGSFILDGRSRNWVIRAKLWCELLDIICDIDFRQLLRRISNSMLSQGSTFVFRHFRTCTVKFPIENNITSEDRNRSSSNFEGSRGHFVAKHPKSISRCNKRFRELTSKKPCDDFGSSSIRVTSKRLKNERNG